MQQVNRPVSAPQVTSKTKMQETTTKSDSAAINTRDRFSGASDGVAKAVAVINEAANFPLAPETPRAQKAWLMEGYARLIRMETAFKALDNAQDNKAIGRDTYNALLDKKFALSSALNDADPDRVVGKEVYSEMAKTALETLKNAKLPPVPAKLADQKVWLNSAKQTVAELSATRDLVTEAWMFGAVSMDQTIQADDAVFKLSSKMRQVEDKISPPKPVAPGHSGATDAGRPLFEATQGVDKLLERKDPVSQTIGVVALPIALTLDIVDLITRPFVALGNLQQPPTKK